jgi:hypothetical protein
MIEQPGSGAVDEPHRGAAQPRFENQSTDPNGNDAPEDLGQPEAREPAAPVKETPLVLDAIASALVAPDPQSFLLGLANALGRSGRSSADGESSFGTILRHLGDALDEELDEKPAFQDLLDALERRHFGARALHEAVPIVAAFLARIVSGPILRSASGTMPAGIADLVRAAAQVAGEGIERSGARSWRELPEIAETIARRAAQRDLSIGKIAEALARLSARLGPGPRERSTAESDHFRSRATGEPRRMVLSGPVEIVILER